MNKPRTIEGKWWIDGDEKPPHFGILSFDPEKGLDLSVKITRERSDDAWIDVFKSLAERKETQKPIPEVIHGADENNRPITLFGFGASDTTTASGLDTHRLGRIQCAILNYHGQSWDEARFSIARVNYTLLTKWMDRRLHLNVGKDGNKEEDNLLSLKFKTHEMFAFEINSNVRLRIEGDTLRDSPTDELRLGWDYRAWFLFAEPASPRTIHDEYALVLLRLLCLLTGERVFIEDLNFCDRDPFKPGGKGPLQCFELLRPNPGIAEAKRDVCGPLMIANFEEIAGDFGSILKRWFECHLRLEPVLDLYFAVFSNLVLTEISQFLLLAQALEVYHARSSKFSSTERTEEKHEQRVKAILESVTTKKYRDWLEYRLRFSNEKPLHRRIEEILGYLERRYNRNCRDALSIVSLISAIVIHIGVALFTAAAVLCFIFGIPETKTILGLNAMMLFIIALGVLTGIYTVIGGLLAVVWTESIQTVLLLIGAVCITAVGYHAVGGWDALSSLLATQPHPLLGKEGGSELSTRTFLHMMHSGGDNTVIANVPWYSILLGYPVIGIWYWCCDQTIVQRVLAAKDEKHARLGPLFCAFIKILPVFLFVLPGVICVALVQKGYFGTETVDGVTRTVGPAASKDTYAFMITHLLPIGMKGLVVAAMLAAAMQTCSAALNSAATLFSYDIWKRWKPQTTDHSLVKIGRWTTIVATLLAIVLSPIFGHYDTIFKGLNVLICYIAPPITAVFLVGVFWKRAGGRAAFITMVAGGLIGALCFFLDFFKTTVVGAGATPESIAASPVLNCIYNLALKDFMLASFGIFCLCVIIQVIASLVLAEPLKDEAKTLVWEHWTEPLRVKCGRGLSDYRVMSAAVLVTFVVLYLVFR